MAEFFTGIDIGAVNLRAITVRRTGERLEVVRSAEVGRYQERGGQKPLSLALAELTSQCPVKGKLSVGSSDLNVLVRYIPTEPMPQERLDRLLRLELEQHAGADGDLAADTFVVPMSSDDLIHCCVVAQADQVGDLLKEMAANDTKPDHVHVQSAALGNALAGGPPIDPDHYGLLIDIGAKNTRLVLHKGDTFVACRQLSVGGDSFTEAVAKEREISFERAEAAKVKGEVIEPALPIKTEATRSSADLAFDDLIDEDDEAEVSDDSSVAIDETPANTIESPTDLFDNSGSDTVPEMAGDATPDIFSDTAMEHAPVIDLDDDSALTPGASVEENADTKGYESHDVGSETSPIWQRPEKSRSMPAPQMAKPGAQTMRIATHQLGPELTRAAEALASQISSSLAWFQSQLKLPRIELQTIALCGGGAQLVGLPQYMQRRLGTTVSVFNPGHSLEGTLPANPGRFAAALGLALSPAPGKVVLDIRPESQLRKQMFQRVVIWPRIAAVLILCAGIVFAVGLWRQQNAHTEAIAVYEEQKRAYNELKSKLDEVQRRRADLQKDLRGIASRVFAARDILYAIRALKEQAEVHRDLWITEFRTQGISTDAPVAQPAPRGGRRGGGAAAKPKHADTVIDRGNLLVSAKLKNDPDWKTAEYSRIYTQWRQSVADYVRPDNAVQLFREFTPVKLPTLQSDVYVFTVRFEFSPTNFGERR